MYEPFLKVYRESAPKAGQVEIFWLGQAGFAIKMANGKTLAIDPYFSDFVHRTIPQEGLGYKRIMPPPCAPEELDPDYLLISHEHGDHFDQDSFTGFLKSGKTQVYTNCTSAKDMPALGADMSRVHVLEKNVPVELDGCTLLPVDCDHGPLAPEALGFILDFGGYTVYYAGDTALSWDRLKVPMEKQPDVAILPINGEYGNLNGYEAAEYAGALKSKAVIPCHFWTFPRHKGCPQEIIESLPKSAPDCDLALLYQGESLVWPR